LLYTWLPLLAVGMLLTTALAFGDWRDPRWRAVVIFTNLFLIARYLVWRVTCTLPPFAVEAFTLLAYVMCGLELLNAQGAYDYLRGLRKYVVRAAEPAIDWGAFGGTPPLVDVFIPTYNEGEAILRRTIIGAKNIAYDRCRVWVLDDGKREAIRRLAEHYGVGYLTRSNNAHYKAGNLNSALSHVMSLDQPPDFIAVFDADFVPRQDFVRGTLSLMQDPTVACVQTPQVFYNLDPFQYAFRAGTFWPDAQRSWFAHHIKCLDAAGTATCCGTSFLVRVKALVGIGGIPVETLSEDTLMSIKMRRQGLRTVVLDEPLSLGLAPEGIHEFLTQRGRWCLGSIQIALSPWGALGSRHGWRKWLKALTSFGWSRTAVIRQFWLLLPVLWWFFGISLLHTDTAGAVCYLFPLLVMRVAQTWLSGGVSIPIITELPNLIELPAVLQATWQGFTAPHKQGFKVTDKGTSRNEVVIRYNPLLWYAALLATLVGGAWYRIFFVGFPITRSWILWFSAGQAASLLMACFACIELPRYRSSERFGVNQGTRVRAGGVESEATLLDISEDGALLQSSAPLPLGMSVAVQFDDVGFVHGRVARVAARGAVGVAFDGSMKDSLIRAIYCRGRYVVAESFSGLRCWRAIAARLWWQRSLHT
jgi:cellulose synthase (UDP-forming)